MNDRDMTESDKLSGYLEALHLGGWRFHEEIGSTNDSAQQWASEGAPDWSVVVADAQTNGRGRNGRQWITQPGAAIALSVIFRPAEIELQSVSRFTALGALGVVHALARIGLKAEIKWPNDVLLAGRKTAGVLVEGEWQGENPLAVIVGIGVNITPDAVPGDAEIRYPATSVETMLGKRVDRWGILSDVIRSMQKLRPLLSSDAIIEVWNQHLAFRDKWIMFKSAGQQAERMCVEGVTRDGRLSLTREDGEMIEAIAGEIVITR